MTISSVSSLSSSVALLQSVQQNQVRLSTLGVELSTGQYADLGLQLGGQAGQEISLRNQLTRIQSFVGSNAVLTTDMKAASLALASANSDAQDVLNSVTAWSGGANSSSVLQSLGQSALDSLVATANTTSNGGYVLGGINSAVAPMSAFSSDPPSPGYQAVDQAFKTAFGISISDPAAASLPTGALESFLSGPFADLFNGANWSGTWSNASDTNRSAEVAPGETISVSTNAIASGFQSLTQAYAMLSVFGGSAFSADVQRVVAIRAADLISNGMTGVTESSAKLGLAQGQLNSATTLINAQAVLLQTQVGKLDDVDTTAVATELATLQTQLQMAYSITSRLHDMNLAQYLPVT